jgi:hypothetical protein
MRARIPILILMLVAIAAGVSPLAGAETRLGPVVPPPDVPSTVTRPAAPGPGSPYCDWTAIAADHACQADVKEEYATTVGGCINIDDRSERDECWGEARAERNEGFELCGEQLEARRGICDLVGQDRYDPDFDPSGFVDPDDIGGAVAPNPYFPLVPGSFWVYEGGDEVVTDTVTDRIKEIEGVRCRVVVDVVEEDGVVIEITDDWYAQDLDGNVWYCGESSRDFELFDGDDPAEPELVSIDGSFKAGRDGARPGILMPADPRAGDAYREEVALGEAEDFAEVIGTRGSESVPAASCTDACLVTRNTTPLEPDVVEFKYYAPGVGLILEVAPGEPRVELVEYYIP